MIRIARFSAALVLLMLTACNLPAGNATPTVDPGVIFTAAAQTVEAQLTQSAALNPPTATATLPAPTDTPLAVTDTPLPTSVVPPTPTYTPTTPCDRAKFIADVTVPDDTEFAPNTTFTKTWRIQNTGTCTWTTAYALVFDHGDAMSGPAAQPLAGNVAPGQSVDISVDLKAPATPGDYIGYWKMRNAAGVLFAQVWVKIKVKAVSTGFNLHEKAPLATWQAGGPPYVTLTFGGPDTDANGFAMYKDGQKVEDGSTPSKVLETHPMWIDDGVISGRYPAYTVQAGERFLAKIGFLAKADGTCGVGNALFQVNYREGGTLHPLGSWTKSCDGTLQNINLDLSALVGHTVEFVLAVAANGSSAQDWAVWINPRVVVP